MHKRILPLLLLLMLLLPAGASGDDCTVTLPAEGLTLSLPEEYDVFTADTPEDSPLFSAYGTTSDRMTELLTSENMVLYAIHRETGAELMLSAFESPLCDFLPKDEPALTVKCFHVLKAHGSEVLLTDGAVYDRGDLAFFSAGLTRGEDRGMEYCTVWDGRAFGLMLWTEKRALTAEERTGLLNIVNSMGLPEAASPSSDFSFYTDETLGLTWDLPEGFTAVPLIDSAPLKAKITRNGDATMLLYGAEDLYSEANLISQWLTPRKGHDNALLTKEAAAEILGTTAENITELTLGEHGYFSASRTEAITLNGEERTLYLRSLCAMKDGYLYLFQFISAEDAPKETLTALLQSITYPDLSEAPAELKASSLTALLPAFAMIAFVIYLFIRRRNAFDAEDPEDEGSDSHEGGRPVSADDNDRDSAGDRSE